MTTTATIHHKGITLHVTGHYTEGRKSNDYMQPDDPDTFEVTEVTTESGDNVYALVEHEIGVIESKAIENI
jgi:hypothetical protein